MGITDVDGFVAAGGHCGLKSSGGSDLALVATVDGRSVPSAGVFTSNRLKAAPVIVSRAHLQATGGRSAGVVLNSGNANAATGARGRADAEAMCAALAGSIGSAPEEVLVCSTGLIGIPLPADMVTAGIAELAPRLAAEGGHDAAVAIMTTDTRPKEVFVDGGGFSVGGMAKGAAMLRPDMATMLAVLTTDARTDPAELTTALRDAVAATFNTVSVDGAQSTNDTVLVLASGSGARPERDALTDALSEACASLAMQMARDAEGHTKVVHLKVVGANDDAEAMAGARAIADSQLVKCSWYGQDPYWGRLGSELGSAGIAFEPEGFSVSYGGTVVAREGVAAAHDEQAVARHMAGPELEIVCDLGLGSGTATLVTNDLTHAYVDENMGGS